MSVPETFTSPSSRETLNLSNFQFPTKNKRTTSSHSIPPSSESLFSSHQQLPLLQQHSSYSRSNRDAVHNERRFFFSLTFARESFLFLGVRAQTYFFPPSFRATGRSSSATLWSSLPLPLSTYSRKFTQWKWDTYSSTGNICTILLLAREAQRSITSPATCPTGDIRCGSVLSHPISLIPCSACVRIIQSTCEGIRVL